MQATLKKVDNVIGGIVYLYDVYLNMIHHSDNVWRTHYEELLVRELFDIMYLLDNHDAPYKKFEKQIMGMQETISYNCRIIHAYKPGIGHKFYYRFN